MYKLIKKFSKNKKMNMLFTILFVMTYSFILLSIVLYINLNNKIINLLDTNINNKLLEVVIEKDKKYLLKQENIVCSIPIYPNEEIQDFKVNYDNNLHNNGEILISPNLASKLNNKESINIKFFNQNYNFKISGVSQSNASDIYLEKKLFEKLFNPIATKYTVLVDEYKNVKKIKNYFVENKQMSLLKNDNNAELNNLKFLKIIYLIVILILIVSFSFIIIFLIQNIYYKDIKNIALLKILGYSSKIITIFFIAKMMLKISKSIILSICIVSLINTINDYIENLTILNISFFMIIISLNLIFLYSLALIKYKKIEPLKVLSG